MSNIPFAILFTLATLFSVTNYSHASSGSASEQMEKLGKQITGCTGIKRKLRQYRKHFTDYHFAFAGRKASTLTGIRGCGWAWSKSKSKAESDAMRHCKKWEVTYGTNGGKDTCRLME